MTLAASSCCARRHSEGFTYTNSSYGPRALWQVPLFSPFTDGETKAQRG